MEHMRIVVLAGGVGGARFLQGVRELATSAAAPPQATEGTTQHEVTAMVNTADDVTLHGLRICPDLDSVMYTLGGGIDTERGWGRAGETWTVKEELAAYGAEPTWFGLGDRDIATHLVRTRISTPATRCRRSPRRCAGGGSPGVSLLPMTDDRVETHVVVTERHKGRRAMHFQEWWIRHRAALPAERSSGRRGGRQARRRACSTRSPTPTWCWSRRATRWSRIGTILAVPGIREALRTAPGPVIGVSPIIGGAPVRGMAEQVPGRDRRRGVAPPASAGSTARGATVGCSTAGWSTTRTPAAITASRSAPSRCG